MISHLVLLKPRADLNDRERQDLAVAFARAIREIPTVRGVRVGARIHVGAGYESTMPDTVDYLASVDFDDADGLRAYLEHPAHSELGRLFRTSLSDALVYDFEVGTLEILDRLTDKARTAR